MFKFSLDDVFSNKKLFILSSNRILERFYTHYIEIHKSSDDLFAIFDFSKSTKDLSTSSFLPNAMTFSEFYNKFCFVENIKLAKEHRNFYIIKAIKNFVTKSNFKIEKSFLGFEDSFASFVSQSSFLLKFYDELSEHKIDISLESGSSKSLKNFILSDTYEDYQKHLDIIAKIYSEYKDILQKEGLSNFLYDGYQIFKEALEKFEEIHLQLEGFITPLQFEILQKMQKISKIFIHFKTDMYNISHLESLFSTKLEDNKRYIHYMYLDSINISSKPQESLNKQINIYTASDNLTQTALVIAKASSYLQDLIQGKLKENDVAIILPDESIAKYLELFDDNNIFNFAMGYKLKDSKSFQILEEIFNRFKESSYLDLELIPFLDKKLLEANLDKNQRIINNKILDPNISDLEILVKILFSSDIQIANQINEKIFLLYSLGGRKIFEDFLNFEGLFFKLLEDIKEIKINDNKGGKIKVIGTLEARSLNFEEIIICSFNKSFVPNLKSEDIFLNSKIRKANNIPTLKDKNNLQKHHYLEIINNTKCVNICYLDNEQELCSYMLEEIKQLDSLKSNIKEQINANKHFALYDFSLSSQDIKPAKAYPNFSIKDLKNKYLSASSINTYNACARKFYFLRVLGLKADEKQEMALSFGLKVHESLHKIYLPYLNTKARNLNLYEEFKDEFTSYMQSLKAQEKLQGSLILKNIKSFFKAEEQRSFEILGLETEFKSQIKGFLAQGRIDRIELETKQGCEFLNIIDFKSSLKNLTNNLQMPFYNLFLESIQELKPYLHLPRNFYFYSYEDGALKNDDVDKKSIILEEILENFGQNVANFKSCKYCEFYDICN